MSHHKAALYVEKCKPLQIGNIETPSPEVNEILIKVEAASFNPVDGFIRYFGVIVETFPFVIGFDIAGTVAKIGSDVKQFNVGDKVFTAGMGRVAKTGAFQEYAIAEERYTALIPKGKSVEEAAAIPLVAFTAYYGMFHKTALGLDVFNPDKKKNNAILIMGGSSNVGQAAIQFAKLCGMEKIITTSAKQHFDFLETLGATHCIDRSLSVDDFLQKATELVPDDKRLFALDCIGNPTTQTQAYTYLSNTLPGRYASVRGMMVAWDTKDGKAPKKVEGTHADGYFAYMDLDEEFTSSFWQFLTQSIAENKIQGGEVQLLNGGLESVDEGLRMIKDNEVGRRKLVVRIG